MCPPHRSVLCNHGDTCPIYLSISVPQQGDIEMEVVYVAPDEDSDDENHEYEDDSGVR